MIEKLIAMEQGIIPSTLTELEKIGKFIVNVQRRSIPALSIVICRGNEEKQKRDALAWAKREFRVNNIYYYHLLRIGKMMLSTHHQSFHQQLWSLDYDRLYVISALSDCQLESLMHLYPNLTDISRGNIAEIVNQLKNPEHKKQVQPLLPNIFRFIEKCSEMEENEWDKLQLEEEQAIPTLKTIGGLLDITIRSCNSDILQLTKETLLEAIAAINKELQ